MFFFVRLRVPNRYKPKDFPNRILTELAHLFSPIIFGQFIISVLQICTLAFQIQLGADISVDRQFANVVTSILALIELLIYCYFGNEVTAEGERIAVAAYATDWHRQEPRQRRYVRLMLMRAQKANVLTGLKLAKCSLASYTSVLNMVGSSFALLRSVV